MQDFIQQKNYTNWTNVTCVLEGAETPLFKQNFTDWLNKDETTSLIKPKKISVGGGWGKGRSNAKFLCFTM